MPTVPYETSVFINVPLDQRYQPLLRALIFAVHDCGFVARSALESDDGSQVRIEKIYGLIRDSKHGIHDLSRTHSRLNMPLELGIFLGAKVYGTGRNRRKRALVLDVERYRYQRICSDIAGQDIRSHGNRVREAIACVRNWLRASPDTADVVLPSAEHICERYRIFRAQLPAMCRKLKLDSQRLEYGDFVALAVGWLKAHPR